MEFERSTQAQHWMFDLHTLRKCRERAVSLQGAASVTTKIERYASGFQHNSFKEFAPLLTDLTVEEQESILLFHIQQLEAFCGPAACFEGLRTSHRVFSTAITYVRRFYLSNSVLDFIPRHICAAAALLAGKVEEEKIEVRLPSAKHIVWSQTF
jgi:cyclin H